MNKINGWGLFSLKHSGYDERERALYRVMLFDTWILGGGEMGWEAATELFETLVHEATKLDGDVGALAVVWGRAAAHTVQLTHTQARCTELINEARDLTRKLKVARKSLYDVKFALEQDVTPTSLIEDIVAALDESRTGNTEPPAEL